MYTLQVSRTVHKLSSPNICQLVLFSIIFWSNYTIATLVISPSSLTQHMFMYGWWTDCAESWVTYQDSSYYKYTGVEEGGLWHWTGLLASSRVVMNLSVHVWVCMGRGKERGETYIQVSSCGNHLSQIKVTNTIIWLNWEYIYIFAIQVSVPTACFECWSWAIGWKGILKRRVWWISFPPLFLMIRSLHALLLSLLVCHHGAVSPVTVHGLVHFH